MAYWRIDARYLISALLDSSLGQAGPGCRGGAGSGARGPDQPGPGLGCGSSQQADPAPPPHPAGGSHPDHSRPTVSSPAQSVQNSLTASSTVVQIIYLLTINKTS